MCLENLESVRSEELTKVVGWPPVGACDSVLEGGKGVSAEEPEHEAAAGAEDPRKLSDRPRDRRRFIVDR